jgi:hypothetical protein
MYPATLAAWALACAATNGANSAFQSKAGPAGNAAAFGSCDDGNAGNVGIAGNVGNVGNVGSAVDALGVNPSGATPLGASATPPTELPLSAMLLNELSPRPNIDRSV